jgi:hypothetical protein
MGTVPVGWTGIFLDVDQKDSCRDTALCNPGLMGLIDRDVVWLPSLRLELRSSNTSISALQYVGTNQNVYCMLKQSKRGEDPYLAGAGVSRARRARQTANCPTHRSVLV